MTDTQSYEVAAILKSRSQSLLQFDMITGNNKDFWGGMTFLKLIPNTDAQQFTEKINHDKIPFDSGKDTILRRPLSDIYFTTPDYDTQQPLPYINQSNVQLLYISLAAALLVLIIACCNYTNMSLSRVLQQLKMIHVEKLMGSSRISASNCLVMHSSLCCWHSDYLYSSSTTVCLFQWIICIPFKRTFLFQPTDATLVGALCTSYVHCPCLVYQP